MREYTTPAAVVLGSILLFGSAQAAKPAAFQPGYYTNVHVVVSASVSGSGQCVDGIGSTFLSATYYPGPSKPGFTDWRAFSNVNTQGEIVAAFPVTQPANQPTWSGTYTTTFQPGGTPVSATFTSTTVYADAHSSVSTGTFTYPVQGGGTCMTTIRSNLLPAGK